MKTADEGPLTLRGQFREFFSVCLCLDTGLDAPLSGVSVRQLWRCSKLQTVGKGTVRPRRVCQADVSGCRLEII